MAEKLTSFVVQVISWGRRISMYFYIVAIRDLLTKTFNHISIIFCSVFHKHAADCHAAL